MEGEFIGERKTDFVAIQGDRAPIRKPQDNLRPGGEFESMCYSLHKDPIFTVQFYL